MVINTVDGLYIAFKRCIFATDWWQTLVAIDSESRLKSFPSFCALPSEVAGLFNPYLSKHPFLGLGQVVSLVLLLCTGTDSEHAILFLCHIVYPETND